MIDLEIVDRFIFWDGDEWMFVDHEYIITIVGEENILEHNRISKLIVDELNKRKVHPYKFEKGFNKILKDFNLK
jgi:hypothetical protein